MRFPVILKIALPTAGAIAGVPTVFMVDRNGNLAATNLGISEENIGRFLK